MGCGAWGSGNRSTEADRVYIGPYCWDEGRDSGGGGDCCECDECHCCFWGCAVVGGTAYGVTRLRQYMQYGRYEGAAARAGAQADVLRAESDERALVMEQAARNEHNRINATAQLLEFLQDRYEGLYKQHMKTAEGTEEHTEAQ